MSRKNVGEARVLRVMEEAHRSMTRDLVRGGASSATVRIRVQAFCNALVTSRSHTGRGLSVVPYFVYDALGQDYD